MILHFLLFIISFRLSWAFNIVGYMPEWRYEGADFDRLFDHLSHLILFSLEMTPKGDIIALDRLPRPELMEQAKAAAKNKNKKLMICFGGNGRSGGFSVMVRNGKNRKRFIDNLVALVQKYNFDGVDYNWEYPGYRMGRGYMDEKEILKDYEGLEKLLRETRTALGLEKVISMAYYPDSKQESLINLVGADKIVDLIHSMSYDQGGPNHSTKELALMTIEQASSAGLPMHKLCLGVPFYGRMATVQGDWVTYEDIVQDANFKNNGEDTIIRKDGVGVGFNGKKTLGWKVKEALRGRLGGVMIWEVGQDCRVNPVKRGDTVHVATCPNGEDSSLLAHISKVTKRSSTTTKEEF